VFKLKSKQNKTNKLSKIEIKNLKWIKKNLKALKRVNAYFIVELNSLTIKYKIDKNHYYSVYTLNNELNAYNKHLIINMNKRCIV